MRKEYFLSEPDFIAENINVLEVERPKGFKHFSKEGRPKHGFIYVINGGMKYSFSNERKFIYVGTGEVIFVPKGCVYSGEYLENDTRIKIIQFDVKYGAVPDYLSKPIIIPLPNIAELIEKFFENIESLGNRRTFYYLHCFYNLMWKIDESIFALPKKYQRLQPAISEITEHWSESKDVLFYAELCDMSEVSFRRYFKEFTGQSPIEYRNELRLNNARILLQSGQYTVSEVAETCGFSNLSFFTRLYKRKFGHTPKMT